MACEFTCKYKGVVVHVILWSWHPVLASGPQTLLYGADRTLLGTLCHLALNTIILGV